jgi:hypothetical protein
MSLNLLLQSGIIPSQSGPFLPSDIPGLTSWHDASDVSTISLSGSLVTAWNDKSNNYNATQAISSNQPSYVIATQNGLNGVRGGTNKFLNISPQAPYGTQFSLFIVVAKGTQHSSYVLAGGSSGVHPSILSKYSSQDFEFFGQFPRFVFATNTVTTAVMLEALHIDGGTTDGYFNTTQVYGSAAGLLSTNKFFTMLFSYNGAGGFFDGTIYEVLLYNNKLTNTNRLKVESYLQAKWGI